MKQRQYSIQTVKEGATEDGCLRCLFFGVHGGLTNVRCFFRTTFHAKSPKPIFGDFLGLPPDSRRLSIHFDRFSAIFTQFQSIFNQFQLIFIRFSQFDSVKNAGIYSQLEGGENNTQQTGTLETDSLSCSAQERRTSFRGLASDGSNLFPSFLFLGGCALGTFHGLSKNLFAKYSLASFWVKFPVLFWLQTSLSSHY